MAKLEYSPVALEKLGAIYRYIAEEQQNPSGAANTIELIRDKLRTLKKMPQIGAPLTSRSAEIPEQFSDTRVLLCGKYLAIYRYDGKTVQVLRIYHTAEDYVRHLFEIYRYQG
jgi:plasmid stabilization system protein ParE